MSYRQDKTYSFKVHEGPFQQMWEGKKVSDVRNMSDRDQWPREGDTVIYYEAPANGRQSHDFVVALITHIQTGYALPEDVAVFSFKVLAKGRADVKGRQWEPFIEDVEAPDET